MKPPIKIMIVDDHQLIVDGLKSLLSGEKNIRIVAEASNGKEALRQLETEEVDVILMDIEMPVMNGCDATRAIISEYPYIKIIALTSFDERSIISKMLNAGASGYLLKNIKKEILLEAIETVVKGEPYYSSEISIIMEKPTAEEALAPKNPQALSVLTDREIEVLKLIVLGISNKEAAEKLFVSPKTIDVHRTNIMRKLDIHNLAGLVKLALENHLLD